MRVERNGRSQGYRAGIARRALLYFIPIVLVTSGVFACLYLQGSGTLATQAHLTGRHLLDTHAAVLRTRLGDAADDTLILAAAAGDPDDWAATAAAIGGRRWYQRIRLLDEDGAVVAGIELGEQAQASADPWPHLAAALALPAGKVLMTARAAGADAGAIITFATPVTDRRGRKVGVVVTDVRPPRLLSGSAADSQVRVSLIDAEGAPLAGPAFATDHPQAWQKVAPVASGRFAIGNGLVAFVTIDPAEAGPGSPVTAGPVWKLVGHMPTWRLPAADRIRLALFLSAMGILLVLLAVGCWRLARFSCLHSATKQALRDSEHKHRDLIENLPIGVYREAVTDGGAVVMANRAAARIFGHDSVEACLQIPMAQRYKDPAQRRGLLERLNQTDRVTAEQVRLLRCDGEPFWASVHLTAVRDDDGALQYCEGLIEDITDRKEAEGRIQAAKAAADAANVTKTRFLANMSHEIRTPMTAILGYANLMMDVDLPAPERGECLSALQRNGEHMLTVINDILDISKIEIGKLPIRQGPCDLAAVVAEVANTMRVRAAAKDIALTIHHATPVPQTIQSDAARIRQVLVNLVSNALKFTETGSVRVVSTFIPHWRGDYAAMRVDVIDTGIGIGPDDIERVFHPFTQAASVAGRRFGGSGLGLAISRSIARLLGGDLAVTSSVGMGSTFSLVIPTGDLTGVTMVDEPADVRPRQDRAAPASLPGLRILLIEAGPDSRKLIAAMLTKAGARVDTAEDGHEGIDRVLADEYDLVLMDMQLPGITGYEATETLRSRGASVPIIALTTHALADDREKCIAAGCDDYLAKPVDRGELIQTVLRNTRRTPAEPAAPEMIASDLADDTGMTGLIDEFVDSLSETISAMSDGLIHGDFTTLGRLAHQLRGSGGGFGYPSLTDAAAAVEDAAKAADVEMATLAMMILISTCQAVSRGRRAPATL